MKLYDENQNRWIDHRSLHEYKARKKTLRDYWIYLGLVLILLPTSMAIILGLFASFISLTFLDEVPYKLNETKNFKS